MSDPSERASDPLVSAWVAANAGAGKTYTLANRVTRLLLAGAKPERILCLTFTRAAAAEMQHRLFRQLGEWAMLPDAALTANIAAIGAVPGDLAKARRLFAQALETPGGLKVLTIHAFCQVVLTRFPIEAGVTPGFDLLDEQTARALIAEARQRVLERAGGGDSRLGAAVAHLVTETSESRLAGLLDAALGNDRRKMDRFFERLDGPLEAAVRRAHGAPDGSAGDVTRGFCAALRREIETLREAKDWLAGGGRDDARASALLAELLAADFEGGFEILRTILLTGAGEPRKRLAVKKLADARPDLLAFLTELQARFCEAEDRRRAAHAASLATAALALIDAVRREYAAAKARQGVLDYDDLILATLNLLGRSDAAAWVLYKLDGGIDHLLIDEAQDTSPEQWEIVGRLTEEFFSGERRGRTVFAVGDEKQSIFSFQGADPAQFAVNRAHFMDRAAAASHPFLDQPLIVSRRSTPEILAFVDAVFDSEAARAGLTSEGAAIRHAAHRAADKGGVEFWTALAVPDAPQIDPWRPVDVEQPDSPVVTLAQTVARTIRGWIDSRAALPGHDAPIRPGDIMILLPRREPFGSEVIRQLKHAGVPVAGADRMRLTEQIAVMDLIALGRFVLQRDDDLNLAALLRSPLCNVPEDDLFALCHGRQAGVWDALAGRQGEPAFQAPHAFLAEMLARADSVPPYEFYAHALTARGKRQALLERLGPEAADAVAEFLSLALDYERAATPSLEGFLHWLEHGDVEIKRDMERGRDEVRVMTVHGAKGLEADIVILPDTTTLPDPPSRKGHLLYDGGDVLFPLADGEAPPRVKAAKAAEMEETLNEHRRLLYVALTRARDRLYVCGFENQRGVRDGSWYRLAEEAAKRLGRPIRRGEDTILGFGHVEDEIRPAEAAGAARVTTLPGWAKRSAPPEQVLPRLIRPSDAADPPEGPALSPLKDLARRRRGQVVHTLLARLPERPRGEWRETARAFAHAAGYGDDVVDETLAVLEHTDFAAAFAPGSQAEVAFQAALPEFGPHAQVTGRIDRLAVTDDSVLILDFKTGRAPPERAEDADPVYLTQMALYRAGAARIFPARRIVCGLVWTDGPRLMTLPDALLDRQIVSLARRLDPSP